MTALTGTSALARLALRRDRVVMPLWVLVLAVLPPLLVPAFTELYPTDAGRQMFATVATANPALVALFGPVYDSSIGALVAWRSGFVPVIVGLLTLLTVVRHTRTEEEAGRRELLDSTVVGRHAGLAAALVTASGASVAVGLLVTLGMVAQGQPPAGSAALGLSYLAVGIVFAAAGGLVAQLTEGAGAARAIGVSVLGLAFVVRIAGDMGGTGDGPSWLAWLSPFAWGQQTRPYAGERWWPLALLALLAVVSTAAAGALSARRDVGAGLLRPRPGPASASPALRSPLALAWRLQRGAVLGWTAGFAVLGLVLGGLAGGVSDLVADSPELAEIFARIGGAPALADAYLAAMMGAFALIASGYAIQAVLRLRTEEAALRAETLLATAVSRLRWASSHLTFAAVGPALALAVGGLVTGLVHGLDAGAVGRELPRVVAGAMVQLPAVWVLAGIAVALFGLWPRRAAVAWGALAAFLLLGQVGSALGLDQRVLNLSPFTHVPAIPGGEFTAVPLLGLAAVAAFLAVTGLAGLRHRDLAPD